MSIFGKKRIFLDYAGGEENPSAIHDEGRRARKRLEEARQKAAALLKCQRRDVIFTSGSTESDNIAVLGVFEAAKDKFARPHIIVSEREHPAVLESAKEAERRGAELDIVPVEKVLSKVKENTVLVSIIYADNETGAIQPVPKLARLIRDLRRKSASEYPLIHADATAAYEYVEVDINKVPADLLTLGKVLVVRPNVAIRPLTLGGGQERGLRSGTEDVSSIEKFVISLEEDFAVRERESARLGELKTIFLDEVMRSRSDVVVNTPAESLPNIVSVSLHGELHEFLAVKLDERGVSVSTGSSCDTNKDEPDKEALRFSFGKKTSEKDVREAAKILLEILPNHDIMRP